MRENTFKNRNLCIIRSLFILRLWVNIVVNPRLSTLILVTHEYRSMICHGLLPTMVDQRQPVIEQ